MLFILSISAPIAHSKELEEHRSRFVNDTQKLSDDRVLEFWGYHNYQGNDQYQNTLRLRYYNPLAAGNWRGRIRLDTAMVSNYSSDPAMGGSRQYSAGQTMVTLWGQDKSFLNPLGALVGVRAIFPFGDNGQWAVGPQFSWSYVPDVKTVFNVTDFSPLVRYMYGFDTKNNSFSVNPTQPPLQRVLQLYPTMGFAISPDITVRIWDENGIIYNSAGGGWFLPLDAMVLHRLTKNLVFAVGGTKQVVQTYRQYDWSVYAKISLNF